MNNLMRRELIRILDGIEKDERIRVVIITSSGNHFCTSVNLQRLLVRFHQVGSLGHSDCFYNHLNHFKMENLHGILQSIITMLYMPFYW